LTALAFDSRASRIADAFFNRSFLDPAVKGEFPEELVEILKAEGIQNDSDLSVLFQFSVGFDSPCIRQQGMEAGLHRLKHAFRYSVTR
jgi:hypothetical protein